MVIAANACCDAQNSRNPAPNPLDGAFPRRTAPTLTMLQIDDLVFNAWGRRFFDHATVTLPITAKVGLVGRNGVGKSTLFKLILGEFSPDGGEIGVPRGATIASVAQEHPATPVSLLDTILVADSERHALHMELETAEPERMADIYARLDEIGADRAPARASEILAGLGFSNDDLTRPMAHFSGGWRMRVALSRPPYSPNPTCCYWTSRPIISTSKAPCGWKRGCANIPKPPLSSAMTANC